MTHGRRHAWIEPGAHLVTDGVHRIPLALPQDGLRAINVYALETDSGLALVDGGWHRPGTYQEFCAALSSIGRQPDEIHDVFVTHIHRDHYTFAVELRRRHGCRIHLGAAEEPGFTELARVNSNVPETSIRELRRAGAADLVAQIVSLSSAEPFDLDHWGRPDTWIRPGRLPLPGRNIESVFTPGHTKGHMVFRDTDTGITFTGDHVLPTITPSIGFELGEWELPLDRFLNSLQLMLGDQAMMAPAHGPVGGPVGPRAQALLDHHDRRFAQILDALTRGIAEPGVALAHRLTWTRREHSFTALDPFNQMIAICETMAHLDVLVARERLTVNRRDGIDLFSQI